ncbi:MAG TPA: class II fructose-bisphosphate aldolase [Thermomicrobiales bacterium]|jgi:fructose/tagatose bisphosphate aldolase|nr:class II fructose-bisphosphate aldolase [Thermomicrobiales bacterium]
MTPAPFASLDELLAATDGVLDIHDDHVHVLDEAGIRGDFIERLVRTGIFPEGELREAARWLIRATAEALGAFPASINDVYLAAGRGAYQNITTPAINVRTLTFDIARTIFQVAERTNTGHFVFEIARSEMSYSWQRPADYSAAVLGAAVAAGWRGPVFIQGDHFQAARAKFAEDPDAEIERVRKLSTEAIAAGFFNIDIDASTLVDIEQADLVEQQRNNYERTAELLAHIRAIQPEGITVSVGAEIGEVGKHNSTVDDLDAFMTGFQRDLADREGDLVGISKISVQTGTSHGGTVLPDGSIKEVAVDFQVLADISAAGRERYGIGGAVQHGASTLPESAFGRFAESNAIEVHLATAFQNAVFDSEHFPAGLRDRIYEWLRETRAQERKEGQTDAQFFYSTRKRAFGPFKEEIWGLPQETRDAIMAELAPRFELIMRELGVAGQRQIVEDIVRPVIVPIPAPAALRGVTTS